MPILSCCMLRTVVSRRAPRRKKTGGALRDLNVPPVCVYRQFHIAEVLRYSDGFLIFK